MPETAPVGTIILRLALTVEPELRTIVVRLRLADMQVGPAQLTRASMLEFNERVPVNPETLVTVIVALPKLPRGKVRIVGEANTLKVGPVAGGSGGGGA